LDYKYIYFEIKYNTGVYESIPTIENENVLLNKPKTNSSGLWGFLNMNERKGLSKPTFSVTDQCWVDLEKIDLGADDVLNYKRDQIKYVLTKLGINGY
jgi:hypothetical protein